MQTYRITVVKYFPVQIRDIVLKASAVFLRKDLFSFDANFSSVSLDKKAPRNLQITAYKLWSAYAQCRPTVFGRINILLVRKYNHMIFFLLVIALAWKLLIASNPWVS